MLVGGHDRTRCHEQRIAVGRRLGGKLAADVATGPGAVVHHDGLAPHIGEFLRRDTGHDIGRAARRKRHDDPHRLDGKILRACSRSRKHHTRNRNRLGNPHVAHIDEPQHKGRGQTRFPGPKHAPGRLRPQGACHQGDGGEEHSDLCGGGGYPVQSQLTLDQIGDAEAEDAGERRPQGYPSTGHVKVEQSLHVAHLGFAWSDHQCSHRREDHGRSRRDPPRGQGPTRSHPRS